MVGSSWLGVDGSWLVVHGWGLMVHGGWFMVHGFGVSGSTKLAVEVSGERFVVDGG